MKLTIRPFWYSSKNCQPMGSTTTVTTAMAATYFQRHGARCRKPDQHAQCFAAHGSVRVPDELSRRKALGERGELAEDDQQQPLHAPARTRDPRRDEWPHVGAERRQHVDVH